MEDIIKNYVEDHNKKFKIYLIYCKWKLHFSNTIIDVESDNLLNLQPKHSCWKLRSYLISKIENYESDGHKFSYISEMNIVFITELRNITYEHYLTLPKPMIEWTVIKKLTINPNLIEAFNININTKHPLIRKYIHIIVNREN